MKIYEMWQKQKLSSEDKKLINDIEQYGLVVLHILEDEEGPAYSFSIGLYDNFQHPEILLIGIPQETAQVIINNIANDIKNGQKYKSNEEYEGIIKRYTCFFKKVNQKYYKDYLGSAMWYYGSNTFPVIQCIYPDQNHHYPWDSKFDENGKWHQPMLNQ